MFFALILALLGSPLGSSPALAHGGHAVAPNALIAEWRPDFLLAVLVTLAALTYGRGLARLWRQAGTGRGIRSGEAAAFAGGILVLALALLSPLETATGTLLTAHMVQHVLLIAIAPPLIIFGRPDAALAFALPQTTRRSAAVAPWLRVPLKGLRHLARPLPAAGIHAAAIWIWHAPGPFQAALASDLLHDLEHASFFLTALLFWQSVIVAARGPATLVAAILATLATLIQGGFLGALITLSARPLYPAYSGAEFWGLTPLADQQLAGLVMWIPMGAVYLLTGLVLAARLVGPDEPQPRPGRGRC